MNSYTKYLWLPASRLLVSFIGFLLLISSGYSQEPYIKTITEDDGLPSSTVYDILQDRTGHLWVATDYGVSRYDGYNFENFSTEQGLPDNSTLSLYEDPKGRIWFLSYGGYLSYYYHDSITTYNLSQKFVSLAGHTFISKIYIDSLDHIWFTPQLGGEYTFNEKGELEQVQGFSGARHGYYYLFFEDFEDGYIVGLTDLPDLPGGDHPDFYRDKNKYYIKINSGFPSNHRYYQKIGDGHYLASCGNVVYHIRDYELVDSLIFDHRVIDLYLDQAENIWISEFYNGVYKYSGGILSESPVRYFNDKTISRILQDHEGNYWFTTTGDGVLNIFSFDFLVYSRPGRQSNYRVLSMDASDNALFFSTYDQKLFYMPIINDQVSLMKRLNVSEKSSHITDLLVDSKDNLWLASMPATRYNINGKPLSIHPQKTGRVFAEAHDKSIIVGARGIYKYFNDTLIFDSGDQFDHRIFAIQEDNSGTIWLGTYLGLYYLKDTLIQKYNKFEDFLSRRISSLGVLKDRLLVGTSDYGLLILDDAGIHVVDDNQGLGSKLVRSIFVDNDSVVWIGTNKGLTRLIIRDQDSFYYSFKRFTNGDGLPSGDINDITRFYGRLWLGTDQGLVSFNPANMNMASVPPAIFIESIIVNNKTVPLSDNIVLEYDQNNIRINFKGISFKGPENIYYRYKLQGHNKDRIFTKNTYAYVSNLAPGEYIFLVNVGNADDIWNPEPYAMNITIKKHFTQTLGFILSVIVLIILLVVSIMYVILGYQKYKEGMKRDLLMMEQKLLRSQMNPHFVFNSLLAIQSFIYKKDAREAAVYLSRFAKLIRLILNSSRQEYVPLEQELDYLKYYLDLQRLRFENKFSYFLEVDKNIDVDRIAIPPLLAQPFIENAIEHGIKNSEKKGVIVIRFTLCDQCIMFEVEDNGIGMVRARDLAGTRPGDYEPLGMTITKERLKLLNMNQSQKVTFSVSEAKDDDGMVTGTKVAFNIKYENIGFE